MERVSELTIEKLQGIGPKTAAQLKEAGLRTAEDLLRYFPADYEIPEPVSPIRTAEAGRMIAVRARIVSAVQMRGFGRDAVISFRISDGLGFLRVSFFHMPYLKGQLRQGQERIFRGVVRDGGKYGLTLIQPRLYDPEEYEGLQGRIRPRYVLPAGISQKRFSAAVRQALDLMSDWPDLLPPAYTQEERISGKEAVRQMHFPESRSLLEAARSRLVLEEFTLFILRVRLIRQSGEKQGNPCPMPRGELAAQALQSLPYTLTEAQKTAFAQIRADLSGPHRMNRLLQGDVGSGKTAVALLALLTAADNGFQGAFMAPTEVLAEQHYAKLSKLLAEWQLPVGIVLLTGSVKSARRRDTLRMIRDGEAGIVIGTHALIQEGVEYRNLGLVITDEQHRFGVRQRGQLAGKGDLPHTLVMSATPIPRTLAIILYGDLDVSVLHELPGGRKPIRNAVVTPAARKSAYRLIEKEIRAGHRAYIICPFIEASESLSGENVEDYAENVRKAFPEDISVGLLHGRLKAEEKNQIMRDFVAGKIQLLVSTTVVEVGVDVPEATVMMVENAERFGLAQLHQLRGRVGRGEAQSYAIFVDGSGKKEKNKRLEIMNRSNDGFEIAEEDLRLRGPGDLFGIRQSGEMHFRLGDIYTDHAILLKAAAAASGILQEDPQLLAPEHGNLRQAVLKYGWQEECL
ncbi:MAG: ATP-dependent DNA helicase RecG [Lachnospiraceae bacterium]|nr:ATP-dependent DNA helicase RecG [Lachnospiraceae bacterium]